MADPERLALGELHLAKTAEYLLQIGRHDVLDRRLADRLITFHPGADSQLKEREDAGCKGQHKAVAARSPGEAARY